MNENVEKKEKSKFSYLFSWLVLIILFILLMWFIASFYVNREEKSSISSNDPIKTELVDRDVNKRIFYDDDSNDLEFSETLYYYRNRLTGFNKYEYLRVTLYWFYDYDTDTISNLQLRNESYSLVYDDYNDSFYEISYNILSDIMNGNITLMAISANFDDGGSLYESTIYYEDSDELVYDTDYPLYGNDEGLAFESLNNGYGSTFYFSYSFQNMLDDCESIKNLVDTYFHKGYDAGDTNGYNQGLSEGYDDGYDEGYDLGYSTGESNGYNSGLAIGYGNGFSEGESAGYNAGYQVGLDEGYDIGMEDNEGYDLGYHEGVLIGQKDNINQNAFKTLFNSILNAPYNIFSGLLNFDFMGVNLFNLFSFAFTSFLVLWLIKLFIK